MLSIERQAIEIAIPEEVSQPAHWRDLPIQSVLEI